MDKINRSWLNESGKIDDLYFLDLQLRMHSGGLSKLSFFTTIYGSSLLFTPLPFLAGGGGGLGEDIIFQDRHTDLLRGSASERTRHGAKGSGVVVDFFILCHCDLISEIKL
jgi:hypothetical protein